MEGHTAISSRDFWSDFGIRSVLWLTDEAVPQELLKKGDLEGDVSELVSSNFVTDSDFEHNLGLA